MKYLLFMFLFPSAFAQQIYSDGMNCVYTRQSNGETQREQFSINKSGPRVNLQKRESGVLVIIDAESFKVEFRENSERKVQTQSVKEVWSLKRQPSELKAATKIGQSTVEVICR
ncbi:MAG: hypothetical protein LW878_11460 [Proteobacteria bacterium]|jgi:hypothetical protein|nr:hypothetical protein [Pseudomonadota bacterium]